MINFSVFQIHLVHFSVQVTTWWWSESSRGLIGAEGLCIGFIEIVVLVGHIGLFHLFFRKHLILLPVFLSDTPVKLSFGGASSFGNHILSALSSAVSPLKVEDIDLVQLSVIMVICSFKKNIFSEIQVSFFHNIAEYIFVHHYHDFLLYFLSFDIFTLHISHCSKGVLQCVQKFTSITENKDFGFMFETKCSLFGLQNKTLAYEAATA